jgi:ubiquinone/menaquinone biosynthesis C-methylase UbiE
MDHHPEVRNQEKIDQFRERVRKDWDDPQTVAAWRKWSRTRSETFREVTHALVDAASPSPGHAILDIASGAGQPALSLAAAVAPNGTVTATDQSAGMLEVVQENARHAGLSNLRYRQAHAESLPFPDRTFDRLTCRFGAMFFSDPRGAMKECLRVLLPRGRAAFMVWGPPQQPFFAMTAGVLRRFVDFPEPEEGAPHIFRYAVPGSLSAVLRDAGFTALREEQLRINCERQGTPEEFWEEFREIAAPFRPLIHGLSPDRRAQLDAEVLAAMRKYESGGSLKFHVEVNLACGARP